MSVGGIAPKTEAEKLASAWLTGGLLSTQSLAELIQKAMDAAYQRGVEAGLKSAQEVIRNS